jgi:predicted SnoaL-like aldol condensation-catalyzing enzyme
VSNSMALQPNRRNVGRAVLLASPAILALLGAPAKAASSNAAAVTNKKVVIAFYNQALNDKDAHGALQYLAPRYIQHNPNAEDGTAGFIKYIEFIHQTYPSSHSEIKAAFAVDDFVILHVHTVREPGQRGNAIAEFFRLADGKIVEHWDVIQLVPEKDVSGNGMF